MHPPAKQLFWLKMQEGLTVFQDIPCMHERQSGAVSKSICACGICIEVIRFAVANGDFGHTAVIIEDDIPGTGLNAGGYNGEDW